MGHNGGVMNKEFVRMDSYQGLDWYVYREGDDLVAYRYDHLGGMTEKMVLEKQKEKVEDNG